MTLVRILRNGKRELVSYRAGILCLAAFSFLLVAGPSPDVLHFTHGLRVGPSADHLHKQYFDLLDCQSGSAPAADWTVPPTVTSPHLTVADAPHLEIASDGWRRNRPPPIR
jgi:hypothetical protein